MKQVATKKQIDHINDLVEKFKEKQDEQACAELLQIFRPFIIKHCKILNKLYSGVFTWADIEHQANLIFYDLLDEYEIGGPAYFNVLLQRKFHFRLRYVFVKEIKHRTRNLCHNGDQLLQYNLIDDNNTEMQVMDALYNRDRERLKIIAELMESDLLTDRECHMIRLNIFEGKDHKEISEIYGISRSRTTRVIRNALNKLQREVLDYERFTEEASNRRYQRAIKKNMR